MRWLAIVVLACCLLPYLPGINGPFQLDDRVNLESIHVGDASASAIASAAFNNDSGPLGRPLSALTFIANQLLDGYDTTGYKITNLLIHFVNGVLVLVLSWHLLALLLPARAQDERRWIALLASVIWMVHPLQVSTALYVIQRMTELATLFMMAAVLAALVPIRQPGALPRPGDGLKRTTLVAALAFVGLLCKETAVLVPFLLLAIAASLPPRSRELARDTVGKRWFWWSAAFVPSAGAVLLAALNWERLTAGYASRHFTLTERLLTEPVILAGYLKSFFLPDLREMGLYLDATPVVSPGDPWAWLGPAALVLVLGTAVAFRRRAPLFAFATFWFVACHLLESSIVGLELAFEHRNYLALLGPALLVATGVVRLASLTRARVAVLVGIALVVVFAGMTFVRASNWSDHRTFVETSLRHHPDSVRAQTEYAMLESMDGANHAAIFRITEVRRSHPDLFFPMAMDMDFACVQPGYVADWDRILALVRAYPQDRDITAFYKGIALRVLSGQCKVDIRSEFKRHLDEVVEIYRSGGPPDKAQFFLMIQADFQSDPEASRRILRDAIEAAPRNPAALYRLAYFELNQGNIAGAEAAIAALEARVDWWRPSRHRVAELQRHLEDLRREKQSG